jgi:hypothetical protein
LMTRPVVIMFLLMTRPVVITFLLMTRPVVINLYFAIYYHDNIFMRI